MAWSMDGGWIGVGETVTWEFSWAGLAYQDIQVVQAKPLPENLGGGGFIKGAFLIRPALLVISEPGLRLVDSGGPQGYGYVYSITVTNKGPEPVPYHLVGTKV